MLLTALLATSVWAGSIEDYFPHQPGTKWTYEDSDGRQLVQEAMADMELEGGQMATPIATVNGALRSTELFRIDGDTVMRIGFYNSAKKPPVDLMASPQVILRIGNPKAEWSFTDSTFGANGPIAVQIKSTSNMGKTQKVLDKAVETLLVHTVIKYGGGRNAMEQVRDSTYGKGVGMIETTEATKVEGKTVKRVLKLVKFEQS